MSNNSLPLLTQTGPPPNSEFLVEGRRFVGEGSPENRVAGYVGDQYLDRETRDVWNKVEGDPRRETTSGWYPEAASMADIRDFGVRPDSTSDQTSVIQTALDASATEGVILSVPDGVFRHGMLTLSGVVRVRGAGRDTSIFKSAISLDSTSGLWNVSSGAIVSFEDVWLHGNDAVNRTVRVNENADVQFRNSVVSNAYGSISVSATVSGILVGGGGRFRFLDSAVQDCSAVPDGNNTGNVPGTVRGIHIAKLSTEDPPLEVLISRSTFKSILSGTTRNEDSDAISYQSFGQDTKGNVKILGNHFEDIGKRCCKILSPGVIFAHNDCVNNSTSLKPMYSIVSVNSSDVLVHGNRAHGGAATFFCDIGNTVWDCRNVTVKGNEFSQGADPVSYATGCRAAGFGGFLTTGVVISGNVFRDVLLGVQLAGGLVGASVTNNYVNASESGIHIGVRYSSDIGLAYSSYCTVSGNVGIATSYGVYWKHATHCIPGVNAINAPDQVIADTVASQTPTTMFDNLELWNIQMIGGFVKNASQILVGSVTPTTFPAVAVGATGSFTPQVQVINNTEGGKAMVAVATLEGVNNGRAGFYSDDLASEWGLDSTFSSGTRPFVITQAGVEWLRITSTRIAPALAIVPNSGNAIDIGSTAVFMRSGYFQTGLQLGKGTFGTGLLTFAHLSHAFLNTFKSSASQAASWNYIFPADTPVAGDALRVTSVAGSTVTLEWAP